MAEARSLPEQKRLLRKKLREKLAALSCEEKKRRSGEILKQLLAHPKFIKAKRILSYLSLETEVETRPLVEEARKRGKRIYVPRIERGEKKISAFEVTSPSELKPGPYGILEPPADPERRANPGDLDFLIVPGLGFDRQGGRLGRGGGHFDQFLKEARNAYKMGLAFDCQIVDRVPREPSDIAVDEVLIA